MHRFEQLVTLEKLLELDQRRSDSLLRVTVPTIVGPGQGFPVYAAEMGRLDADAPCIGFFGGVHGNERIGTEVVLAFLHSLLELSHWDESLHHLLSRCRILFMPLINPVGMYRHRRSNGHGIDLMRNADIDSPHAHWLLGGQRISRLLPWFRGKRGQLAPETQAVMKVVRERMHPAAFSIALDCHSGFGVRDSIWFPYASSRQPIPNLAEVYALRSLFRSAYPNHQTYRIEPQCRHYMAHGDLWDALYLESQNDENKTFLPLTLEMGSWLWVKKNPRQIFSRLGLFNPLVPHRRRRILRQHLLWFDFLSRAVAAHDRWCPQADARSIADRDAWAYWGHHYKSSVAREK